MCVCVCVCEALLGTRDHELLIVEVSGMSPRARARACVCVCVCVQDMVHYSAFDALALRQLHRLLGGTATSPGVCRVYERASTQAY